MKNVFKNSGLLLIFIFVLACSKQDAANGTSSEAAKAAGSGTKSFTIGIAKIVQHEALDATERGIQDQLQKLGINATFDLQNANGDLNAASEIAAKFKTEKVDVAVGLATPMAVSLANAIKDTPVVFTAVTDPVSAKLVATVENGKGNVTGVSDAIPTVDQIGLFQQLAGIKTLGYIYTSSEPNSISSLALVEEGCKKYGITLVRRPIKSSAELRQAILDIVNRIDGIYVSTDNTVVSALPVMIKVCHDAKKPIFSGDPTNALNGGCVAANGINYYTAGLYTGDMVADILNGKNPADIPVKFLSPTESDLLFDLDEAANCGITIPQDLLSKATYIFHYGQLTSKQTM